MKLLRVLRTKELTRVGGNETIRVDFRAGHGHQPATSRRGGGRKRFRDDLYFRINVFRIELPPLRERPGDVPRSPRTSSHGSRSR